MDLGSYLLGVATLPALAGAVIAALWAFTPSHVVASESHCRFCDELDWDDLLPPKGDHRLNIVEWAVGQWHALVRARRRPHRVLWQDFFDAHPDWLRDHTAWKRYGLRPIAKADA